MSLGEGLGDVKRQTRLKLFHSEKFKLFPLRYYSFYLGRRSLQGYSSQELSTPFFITARCRWRRHRIGLISLTRCHTPRAHPCHTIDYMYRNEEGGGGWLAFCLLMSFFIIAAACSEEAPSYRNEFIDVVSHIKSLPGMRRLIHACKMKAA